MKKYISIVIVLLLMFSGCVSHRDGYYSENRRHQSHHQKHRSHKEKKHNKHKSKPERDRKHSNRR